MGQHALTVATNLASGVTLTDSQSEFRALSNKALHALAFRRTGFSVESEMQFLVSKHHLSVKEVPVTAIYAEGPKRNPFGHGFQVLKRNRHGEPAPSLFSLACQVFLLTVRILLGLVVVDRYNTYQNLAVGYALISILLAIIGIRRSSPASSCTHCAFLSQNGR